MGTFTISTDPAALDVALIHRFLSTESSWAIGIPLATLTRAMAHSLCFGAYLDGRQVGFARVVTDYATFANLVDVFVVPGQRGRGYSQRLLERILAEPALQGLRRFTLATADAHGLYARYGFSAPARPAALMERYFPTMYADTAPDPGMGPGPDMAAPPA